MTRPSNHHIHRPIIDAPYPNMRWGIDTVDMKHFSNLVAADQEITENKGYGYILTCIDYASRKVWARALKDQKASSIVAALKSIMEESETVPQIIQSDQGSSFCKEYKRFLDGKKVKIIYTKTYSPQSNGLIENFNGQLRKMLRDIMTRTKSIQWINHLQECVDNKNNSKNETTKKTPNQVWTAGLHETYVNEINEHKANTIQEARSNLLQNAKNQIDKFKVPVYKKGDLVHVKLSALYTNIRKIIKEGNKKLLVTTFTPEVYRIHSVIQVRGTDDVDFRPNLIYTLETLKDKPKIINYRRKDVTLPRGGNGRRRYSRGEPMRFFAKDFIKVDTNNQPANYSNLDVLRINDFYKKLGLIAPGNELAQEPIVAPIPLPPAPRPIVRLQTRVTTPPIPEQQPTRILPPRSTRGKNTRFGEGVTIGGMIHTII